jgi:hypothetical protein
LATICSWVRNSRKKPNGFDGNLEHGRGAGHNAFCVLNHELDAVDVARDQGMMIPLLFP